MPDFNLFRNPNLNNALDGRYPAGDAPAPPDDGLLFTPTINIDAELGTLGQTYVGTQSDQWSSDAGRTFVDNTQVRFGDKSFVTTCRANFSGFGEFGGIKQLPNLLYKGDSLHCQFSSFFPSATFDFNEVNPWLKFFRIHTANADGSNAGYQDIYIDNDNPSNNAGLISHIYEGVQQWTLSNYFIQYDRWDTFEFRIDFDEVALDDGGTGRVRVWVANGSQMDLIIDVTDQKTLPEVGGYADRIHLFTYWNGEPAVPTVDQTCYVDRIVVEPDVNKLVETDAAGNKIIGGLG